jgi:Co/Zn/Cd efflux system component
MLTHRRHRYLTRWPRSLAFAFATMLLLLAVWRSWQAWERIILGHEIPKAVLTYRAALASRFGPRVA